MKIGIQLYTLRKFIQNESGISETFRWCSEQGVDTVQLSGAAPLEAEKIKGFAQKYNLFISATHTKFDLIKNDLARVAEEHLTFGCPQIGIGSLPHDFSHDADGFLRFADFLNKTSQRLEEYGLEIAYHNHAFEFKKHEGKPLLDLLIDNTSKSVNFIFDTYWAYYAGYDPAEYIRRLAGRLRNLHLKDYRKILGIVPIMCEVGRGRIDFADCLSAAEASGTQYALIEQDVSKDPKKSLVQSLTYLRENFPRYK